MDTLATLLLKPHKSPATTDLTDKLNK